MNQVERWFAEITRKRLRRGTFRSVRALVKAAWQYLSSRGMGQGWIIDEGYYNDPQEASELNNARLVSGNVVFYLMQWTLKRTGGNEVPLQFNEYAAQGW